MPMFSGRWSVMKCIKSHITRFLVITFIVLSLSANNDNTSEENFWFILNKGGGITSSYLSLNLTASSTFPWKTDNKEKWPKVLKFGRELEKGIGKEGKQYNRDIDMSN